MYVVVNPHQKKKKVIIIFCKDVNRKLTRVLVNSFGYKFSSVEILYTFIKPLPVFDISVVEYTQRTV